MPETQTARDPLKEASQATRQKQKCYIPEEFFMTGIFDKLSPRAIKVYLVLRRHADQYHISELTLNYIQKKCGFKCYQTLYFALIELQERGLLHEPVKLGGAVARLFAEKGKRSEFRNRLWLFHT